MTYELQVDGQIVDRATIEKPLDYIQGTNMLIPGLEAVVNGLQQGDTFNCSIPPEEGYGQHDSSMVFDIPKDSFMYEGKIREDLIELGRFIPMLNSQGDVCYGMIKEIKETAVTMDFNPPMAGKTLNFTGKIIAVREATDKELTEGLHGEFLPQEGHQCKCGHHNSEGGCCHGEGHSEGGCCHGEGHSEGGCCHHHDNENGCCHS